MKKKIIVAPINSDSVEKTVLMPIREFPTERMIFLSSPDGMVKADGFSRQLDKLGIPSSKIKINSTGNPWEDYFVSVAEVLEGQERENIVINISTADRISQCALTNAAHVNGIKAIAVFETHVMVLPILKLSYSNLLSPKKLAILQELHKSKCSNSLEQLAKATGMSLQLLSYHINGSAKSKGLSELELVDTQEMKGRVQVCLSTMGRLFMRGYMN
jgi:DNA-binding transcriptional ArsR family regulator